MNDAPGADVAHVSDRTNLLRNIMAHVCAGAAYVIKWAHQAELEWQGLKADSPALANLIEEGADVARAEMTAHGIDVGKVEQAVNLAQQVGAAVEAIADHANKVAAGPPAPEAVAGHGIANALGAAALLAVLMLGSLGACTTDQAGTAALKPGAQQAVNVACVIDNAAPVMVPVVLSGAGSTGVTLQQLDDLLVHPLVKQACARYGGRPAGALPSATSAPANAPVVAVPPVS